MRTKLVLAMFCGLFFSISAPGQQKAVKGGRISCPILRPKVVKIVRPIYPVLARQAYIEGMVSLRCIIGLDGAVEKIEVQRGHPLLIQAATEAVAQWRYKPLLLRGKAVEAETVVDISFQLPKDKEKSSSK